MTRPTVDVLWQFVQIVGGTFLVLFLAIATATVAKVTALSFGFSEPGAQLVAGMWFTIGGVVGVVALVVAVVEEP